MGNEVYTNPVAMVSGASMGIGLEMAKQLAMHRYNLVLVALPGEQLISTSHESEKQFGVKVLSIEEDLSNRSGC
jgi:short-subunit dehydrogenase